MKSEGIKGLAGKNFRRLIGFKRSIFKKMTDILRESDKHKQAKGGRKLKLILKDRFFMALEYIN